MKVTNLKLRIMLFLGLSLILIPSLLLISVSAKEDVCEVCSSRQIVSTISPQLKTATISEMANNYCPSVGGSHSYEYISSTSYIEGQDNTATVIVDIAIANPTGCSYGSPCPEYDQSPEYVNAWIDWNGDGIFSENEKILDDALTGYSNINYHGFMTSRKSFTIPSETVGKTVMRVNLGWGYDPNDPCSYSWSWGDVNDQEIDISRPDLSITSQDISISQNIFLISWLYPFNIAATIHNNGNWKAENIEVKFIKKIQNYEVKSEIKTINEIQAGESATISVNWNFDPAEDIEVIIDPQNTIKEQNEDNNTAITYKITGKIQNSDLKPLKHIRIVYLEQSGSAWQEKFSTFTNSQGEYSMCQNFKAFSLGANGKVRASMEFSPNDRDIKMKFYDDSQWDSGKKEVFFKDMNSFVMKKDQDYTMSTTFGSNEGGITYEMLVLGYEYFKNNAITSFVPPNLDIEFMNDDSSECGGSTSCQWGNNIAMWTGHTSIDFIPVHEYGHRVSQGWNLPYNPIGENWANYAAALARNDPVLRFPGVTKDISKDSDTRDPQIWNLQLAGAEWDLSDRYVLFTLKKDSPKTVKQFFEKYTARDPDFSDSYVKQIFRNHGYNTTGWKGADGTDPNLISDSYSQQVNDINNDGIYESLSIEVGLNLDTPETYTLYGFLTDSSGSGEHYCFASSDASLPVGDNKLNLVFDGTCISKEHLSGSYYLTDLYLMSEDSQLDYRSLAYTLPDQYESSMFTPPIVAPLSYSDYGVDTNGDSKYESLAIDSSFSVQKDDNYLIILDLYTGDGKYVVSSETYTHLNQGIQNVHFTFDGESLYNAGFNGNYDVVGISIKPINGGAEKDVFSSTDKMYTTGTYEFNDFNPPFVLLGSPIEDLGQDIDGNGLFDYLTLTIPLTATSSGDAIIQCEIYSTTDEYLGMDSVYVEVNPGTQIANIYLDGKLLRKHSIDGPYNVKVNLINENLNIIDSAEFLSDSYSSHQFEASDEDIFQMIFNDYGYDSDGNGLYNDLITNVDISAANPGHYRLEGYLYSGDGQFVAFYQEEASLSSISSPVILAFDGENIRSKQIPDSEYLLRLKIFNDASILVADFENIYKTSSYDYTQFDGAVIKEITDQGEDSDNNGLFEYLVAGVTIDTPAGVGYTIKGELLDSQGIKLSEGSVSGTGSTPFDLKFDGYQIFTSKIDGPYSIHLLLMDNQDKILDEKTFNTNPYQYSEFQHLVELKGNYLDYGTDTNSNGLFDYLTFDIEFISQDPGLIQISGRLLDTNGNEILWSSNSRIIDNDQSQTPQIVNLNFDGEKIYEHGINGPFKLSNVVIYHTGDPTLSDTDPSIYTTKPYSFTEFEGNTVRTTKLTYTGDITGQYSDKIDGFATLIDSVTEQPLSGKSITFTIGTQSVSAETSAEGKAIIDLTLNQPPGTYSIDIKFDGDAQYQQSSVSNPFTITKEDARITYTGSYFVSTPSINDGTAKVALMATIQDITSVDLGDATPGDIRMATVTFVDQSNGNSPLGTANIPVILINGDPKTGAASTTFTAIIPNTANSVEYQVGIIVNNYYSGDKFGDDNIIIEVAKPTSNFITGGGYLKMASSSGVYSGDPLSKNNFGFELKFNKKLTNTQGHINIIIRNGVKVYKIKSTVIESLVVKPYNTANPTGTATVVCKANIVDITNPNSPVSLGGNLKLYMILTDKGEPGSNDSIGITLWEGTKLLLSSNWNGAKTVEQSLGGGNIAIH